MRIAHAGRFALSSTALMLVLTACGEDDVSPASGGGAVDQVEQSDTPPAESTADEETELPSQDDVDAYFEAIASHDPTHLEEAMGLAEQGSVAEAYAGYLLASANAAIDGGFPIEGEVPDKVDGGYMACGGTGDDDSCVTWADVEGRNGKIVTFTINDEVLEDRLTAGNGKTIRAGSLAEVTLLYAYKSVQSESLFVVAEVRSGGGTIHIHSYGATYRSEEGRQTTAAEARGPVGLGPESMATVVLGFPGVEPGGVATLELSSEDFTSSRNVQLKTR